MKTFIIKLFKGFLKVFFRMVLTNKTTVLLSLELAAEQSNNKIDDNIIRIVRAAWNNHEDDIRHGAEKLLK